MYEYYPVTGIKIMGYRSMIVDTNLLLEWYARCWWQSLSLGRDHEIGMEGGILFKINVCLHIQVLPTENIYVHTHIHLHGLEKYLIVINAQWRLAINTFMISHVRAGSWLKLC